MIGDRNRIERAGHIGTQGQRLELGCKQKPLLYRREIERFDPEMIAGQEQRALLRIPDRKGEDAVQTFHRRRPAAGK